MTTPLEISESDFDRLIKEIRAGAVIGILLLVMAVVRYLFLPAGPFAAADANRMLVVGEVVVYGTSAFFIWNFSARAGYLLLTAHLIMVALWMAMGFGWSVILGVLFAFGLVRSIQGAQKFALIRAAAAQKLAMMEPGPD
jgi:hypothetical protein